MSKPLRISARATILCLIGSIGLQQAGDARSAEAPGPMSSTEPMGKALYRTFCQGCHMPDGAGATGAGTYPALIKDSRLVVSDYPVALVIQGRAAMPSLARYLNDEQIAAVVNYVRTNFDNHYSDVVRSRDVAALRSNLNKDQQGEK